MKGTAIQSTSIVSDDSGVDQSASLDSSSAPEDSASVAAPLQDAGSLTSTSNQALAQTDLVAVTSGGITFNLTFDAGAPPSFRSGIQQAASILTAAISDQITVNLTVHYTGTGGGAFCLFPPEVLESYSSVRSALISHASPTDTTFNALPATDSIQGQSSVAVSNAELKSLGFMSPTASGTDGTVSFATDIDPSLLVGVALHELTHSLGRIPYGPQPNIFDLYRFTSPGTRLFSISPSSAPPAYFSVDGGSSKLADYGQTSDTSDFLNSGVQGPNDPFNEFYNGGTSQSLSAVDLAQLDALGFDLTSNASITIESFGSTSLVQVGSNYFLYPVGGSSGPELEYGGSPMVAGQTGDWAPIGAEAVSGGYEVVWKTAGADLYTVWTTDSSGNYQSNSAVVAGSDAGVESLETTFQQDLNGDGQIGQLGTGIPPVPVPPSSPPLMANCDTGAEDSMRLDTAVCLGTLGGSDPSAAPADCSDPMIASLALLTNYIASAFKETATNFTFVDARPTPVQDLLTKPLG